MYFFPFASLIRTCHLFPFLRTPINWDLLFETPLWSPLALFSLWANWRLTPEDISCKSWKRFSSISGSLLLLFGVAWFSLRCSSAFSECLFSSWFSEVAILLSYSSTFTAWDSQDQNLAESWSKPTVQSQYCV